MRKCFAVDSSCIVASVCSWHVNHDAAFTEIDRRLSHGERMSVPVHALTEAYSVLTRFPVPNRFSPKDAWALIEANFVRARNVVTLDVNNHVQLLSSLSRDGLGGGRIYDAVIAASAAQGGASTLLTFNARHFEPDPDGISIVVPTPRTLLR